MTDKSDKIVLLSKQDVMNIVTLFADKGNPEDGVEYQGNRYGIVFRDGHNRRSEERRVGKECRSRWSPYH